jgi:hypothetical protein
MLDSLYLEIVLILTQVGAPFAMKVPQAQKLFWTHPMVLLGDEAQVEARFSLSRDSANLDERQVHGLCRTYHCLRNCFGRTRWNSKLTWVMWNLVLVHLETVLVPVQDRCSVCNKHTKGLEIILDTPDGTSS